MASSVKVQLLMKTVPAVESFRSCCILVTNFRVHFMVTLIDKQPELVNCLI